MQGEIAKTRAQLKKLERKRKSYFAFREDSIKKMNSQYEKLSHEEYEIGRKLDELLKTFYANCRHKHIRYRSNVRDDASFEYYIYCKRCNDWIGHVTFDGVEVFDKDINRPVRLDK